MVRRSIQCLILCAPQLCNTSKSGTNSWITRPLPRIHGPEPSGGRCVPVEWIDPDLRSHQLCRTNQLCKFRTFSRPIALSASCPLRKEFSAWLSCSTGFATPKDETPLWCISSMPSQRLNHPSPLATAGTASLVITILSRVLKAHTIHVHPEFVVGDEVPARTWPCCQCFP
ncbi:hypothetical protein VFPPC_17852 [Pochonia chlamydosporia 170]|uniref:Uncharacterized protein n=1 Tax=Pochonia chlamydosporia 170 TaxID=1380566 RepID=A0A219ARY2_METCM|nr:hypothetical protein VFPPC_17852 [Pochonia chlamydosporia 170]OWT42955.1 hypothetical protein VFPPC_17852 [Pochonia chlamydosporia 170]